MSHRVWFMSFFSIIGFLGIVVVMISFQDGHGQNPKNGPGPDFATFEIKKEDSVASEIKMLLKKIPKPALKLELVQKGWTFSQGSSDEPFLTTISAMPAIGEIVDLPHRVSKPNTSLWYSKTLNIPPATKLYISGDDGAQLFVNGIQQKRIAGAVFEINAEGKVDIAVRVLNNAMAGGLREVGVVSGEHYEDFNQAQNIYDRFHLLGNKLIQFSASATAKVTAVMEALDKRKEPLLKKAEAYFEEYPFFIAGPYVQKPNKDSLSILVETDRACNCSLLTGKIKENLSATMEEEQETFLHEFELPVNDHDSVLFYRLKCNNTYSKVYKVKLKEDTDTFSFNVWADSQGGWDTFSQFMRHVGESDDVFGIGVGDLVNNGADMKAWQSFFSTLSISGSEITFYLVPGNHDYDGAYDDLNPTLFNRFVRNGGNNNYFAWTYANCAFIALDPNENFPVGIPEASAQYKWFLEQLATQEWLEADWRFVLVHQPPFSQGWQGYHGEESIKTLILNTAEIGKIDFVVSGHTHDYERLSRPVGNQKVHFLIVGGAGGGLEPKPSSDFPKMDTVIKAHHIGRFDVSGQHLKFTVIGQDNEVLDAFELSK